MKSLYWNIRGVVNAPSILALKRLIKLHKPNYIFIAKPKLDFAKFPNNWFLKLVFKPFAFNNKDQPSLWCFFNANTIPTIISISDQFLAFSFTLDNCFPPFVAVYASTNLTKRGDLWKDLNDLQSKHHLPWSFFGDFNVIIGAHEHRGGNSPAKRPMIDFLNWTNNKNLIRIPKRGAKFTWSNKRYSPYLIERRLDRCIRNHLWFDSCKQIPVLTLSKLCSDHNPLLLVFHINFIRVVSQFKFLKTQTLHKESRIMIKSCWSQKIIGCHVGLNKNIFGNVTENFRSTGEVLGKIQDQTQQIGINDNLKRQALVAQKNLLIVQTQRKAFGQINPKSSGSWKETRTLLIFIVSPGLKQYQARLYAQA